MNARLKDGSTATTCTAGGLSNDAASTVEAVPAAVLIRISPVLKHMSGDIRRRGAVVLGSQHQKTASGLPRVALESADAA